MKKFFVALLIASPAFAACPGITWGYGPDNGPLSWGQLTADYAVCDTGVRQSPVDVPAGTSTVRALDVRYGEAFPLIVQNNGHELKILNPAGSVVFGGVTATLQQFHFHVKGEHMVDGTIADAELHLVHELPGGDVLALAVLIDATATADNAALAPILAVAPPQSCTTQKQLTGTYAMLRRLLPDKLSPWATYPGSLTTPACGQNVTFVVIQPRITISATQLARLKVSADGNARPLQPLNGRAVAWYRE